MSDKFWNMVNMGIDHLKKSPVLQKSAHLADGVMDEMNKTFQHEPISLDNLVKKLSLDTDTLILGIQHKEKLDFVGGELTALSSAQQAEHFSLALKLYFQNPQGKVILKENSKELAMNILDAASQQELKAKQSISYEVNAPTKM